MVNLNDFQKHLGEILNLVDLVYAMMLPSGNDAATAIAEGLGLILYMQK